MLSLTLYTVENDYAVQNTSGTTNYVRVIVFYKNMLCFEGASSSCRVVNLKLPDIFSGTEKFYIFTSLLLI